MVVSEAGAGRNYFGYRLPVDGSNGNPADGLIQPGELAATPTVMEAHCMYTIAGNAGWDPARAEQRARGFWFGEYADSDGGPAQLAKLDQPIGLAWRDGELFIADLDNQRVRRIASTGVVSTVAGTPAGPQRATSEFDYEFAPFTPANDADTGGDGGLATAAQLGYPTGLCFDARGRLYVADRFSQRVRMVEDGQIRTVGGRLPQTIEHREDGDALRFVDLPELRHIACDPDGNVLVTDSKYRRVRRLWRPWD